MFPQPHPIDKSIGHDRVTTAATIGVGRRPTEVVARGVPSIATHPSPATGGATSMLLSFGGVKPSVRKGDSLVPGLPTTRGEGSPGKRNVSLTGEVRISSGC